MCSSKGRTATRAVFAILGALLGGAASAQDTEHQRVGVETGAPHALEFSLEWAWSAKGEGWSAEAQLEYSWKKTLGLGLSLPVSGKAKSAADEAQTWRLRDPGATASWLCRGERARIRVQLGYSYPFDFNGEPGFHAFTPALSIAIVRDPVIIAVSMDARLCLPREAEGYLLWPPFSGSLGLSLWELLNDRVSWRFSISPGLSLGVLRLGLGEEIVPVWSLGVALSFSWDERSWGIGAGWSGSTVSGSAASPGMMNVRGSYRGEW